MSDCVHLDCIVNHDYYWMKHCYLLICNVLFCDNLYSEYWVIVKQGIKMYYIIIRVVFQSFLVSVFFKCLICKKSKQIMKNKNMTEGCSVNCF